MLFAKLSKISHKIFQIPQQKIFFFVKTISYYDHALGGLWRKEHSIYLRNGPLDVGTIESE